MTDDGPATKVIHLRVDAELYDAILRVGRVSGEPMGRVAEHLLRSGLGWPDPIAEAISRLEKPCRSVADTP